jgi:hypothetical protein
MLVAYVTEKSGDPQRLIVQASNGSALELARGTTIRYRDGRPMVPNCFSLGGSPVLPQQEIREYSSYLAWAELLAR